MSKYRKSALNKDQFSMFLERLSPNEIVAYWKEVSELCNGWIGVMTLDKLSEFKESPFFFNDFIDYTVVKKRIKLDSFDQIDFSNLKIESIQTKIPEIREIQIALQNLIIELPNNLEKAESWMFHCANNIELSSNLEATMYFYKKGLIFEKVKDLREMLRIRMCELIGKDQFLSQNIDYKTRAKNNQFLIPEATELLVKDDYAPSLLFYERNEFSFIDCTFIRACDILNITGYDKWISVYVKEIEQSYINIEKRELVLYLFNLCRSDFVLNNASKISLETLLHTLTIGSIKLDEPWKVNWFYTNESDPTSTDYYRIACVIVFAWMRLKPTNLNHNILKGAIKTLIDSQLVDGSWPLISTSIEGDILTTSLAIYSIVASKPKDWRIIVENAKNWLVNQINEVGCWHLNGAPNVYVNAFCLESIQLVNDYAKVTFSVPNNTYLDYDQTYNSETLSHSTIVLCEGTFIEGKNFQFDAKCLTRIFSDEFPNVKFLSIGSNHDVINDTNMIAKSLSLLFPDYRILKLIDRDERSDDEIKALKNVTQNLRVLDLRSIESYLFDDEVIFKLCEANGNIDRFDEIITAKKIAIDNSVKRSNPKDDIKSAGGEYYISIKEILGLTRQGSTTYDFLLYTLCPLITKDMKIYSKLKMDIFNT